MKTFLSLSAVFIGAVVTLNAQRGAKPPPPPAPQPPPPVTTAPASAVPPSPVYVYEQRPMGGRTFLVTPEQAQAVIDKFKDACARAGTPRMLIFLNRELVDEDSGLKLSARSEKIETSRSSGGQAVGTVTETQNASHKNTFRIRDKKEMPLSDRQTMRDVERLFGRPLRMGGVSLVDQRIANQVAGGKVLDNLATTPDSETARRDREVLSRVTDIVLEVLVSSRNITVTEVSGDRVIAVPDIQATAVRLRDSKILGQATAADLLGRAGRNARNYDVREITEATALSLMEDMLLQSW